jgi:hypothetical protein
VFISYAHEPESDTHTDLVRQLSWFLRSHGIDAHLDLPAAEQRQDWALWMADQIRQADLDSAVRAFRVINAKLDTARSETAATAPAPNGVVETRKPEPVPRRRSAIRDEPPLTYHADTNSYRMAG